MDAPHVPPAEVAPVSATDAARLFQPLRDLSAARRDDPPRLGVAVSGGPDSVALFHLLDRWAASRPAPSPRIHLLTVDHALRPESRAEAEAVVRLAESRGRPATLLTWGRDGAPPPSDIQAAAREARYRLLAEAARAHRLDAVVLAHHLDDQAETLMIRLARGSGLRGLAAMAPERIVDGVPFLRPLLTVPKARLVATCRAAGLPFVEDPSNASERFLRARLRRLMPELAALGLTPDRLAATARRLARASAAIDAAVADLARAAAVDHGGVVSIACDALARAPDEIALRLLADAILAVRPNDYGPRAEPLEAWLADFRNAPETLRRRPLAGVVLVPRRDRFWFHAEAGRRGFPILALDAPGESVWDGRFGVTVEGTPPPGLAVTTAAADRRPDLPRAAAASLPVLSLDGAVLDDGENPPGCRVTFTPLGRLPAAI